MKLLKQIQYKFRLFQYRLGQFRQEWQPLIQSASQALAVVTFIMSILCIVGIMVYIGFEHDASETLRIRYMMRVVQGMYAFNVLFNLILNFRNTIRDARVLRWVVDSAILITLVPLLFPPQSFWWAPNLYKIIASFRFLFIVLLAYAIVDISAATSRLTSKRTNPSIILSGSFLFFILLGSILLMLPKCTVGSISYLDSLFVSTSAVCITGLTPVDVSEVFTPLGLLILALLIQIGGLGVITFTSFFALFFSGTNSIYNQLLVRDMVYSKSMNSLLPTLLYILGFTLTVEALGAVAVYFTLPDTLGLDAEGKMITAAFHSLSAFCNAGFSSIPDGMSNAALMQGNQLIYLVSSILIFAGAIGYPILVNFKDAIVNHLHCLWIRLHTGVRPHREIHSYNLNTRLVLYTTLILTAVSWLIFLCLESNNSLAGMSWWEKINQSLFNIMVPRSAGFASVNPNSFLPVTLLIIMVLMWIGGGSQSLAGGIKINTFATMLLNLRAIARGESGVRAFHRRISTDSVRRAQAIIGLSIISTIVFAVLLLILEPELSTKAVLFEVISAVFTVGSSLGITPQLGMGSKLILCLAMFLGRVGLISILVGLWGSSRDSSVHLPTENIIIN